MVTEPYNPAQSFAIGVDSLDDPTDGNAKALAEEKACTKRWLEKIKNARDFDKEARREYARNRKYARGDSGKFEVSVPIAPSYIDVLRSFLFAKNPDVACEPAASTTPPPDKELQANARKQVQAGQDAQTQATVQHLAPAVHQLAATGALQHILPQVLPALQNGGGDTGGNSDAVEAQAQAQAAKQAAPYQQQRSDAKQFAQTMELVIAQLWMQANLKQQGLPLVGSALTIGPGWLKASWQERTGDDPIVRNQLNDLQDNLNRLKATQEELAEGEAKDADATMADLQQQMQGLQGQVEVMVARGLAIDFESGQNIQVATECGPLGNYLSAPWIAHRSYLPMDDARAQLPKIADKLKSAKLYYARKPKDGNAGEGINGNEAGTIANVEAEDADDYTTNNPGTNTDDAGSVAVWELWNKDDNIVLTLVDGVDVYAKAPYVPDPGTLRFYPFFLYQIGVVDGERHPRSLITRSAKLFDEYNRARTNWRTARNRAIPKCGFDDTNLEPAQAKKIQDGASQEMVGFHGIDPTKPLKDLIFPISYADINEKLYDTAPIRAELETIWGIQEALSSSIHTAKTATEAEIQQTGTNSRTAYMRDGLDETLTDLANYTAQVALQKMSHDDVVRIAGPWALWPEGVKIEDLNTLIEVNIRAGSSGKPNTSQKQQVWATVFPLLNNAIDQIGALQQSDPAEVAKCKKELMAETLNRTGDRIDVDRFIPDPPAKTAPKAPPGPPPKPADMALAGPQIVAMTQVCDQVRTGVLSGPTAIAVLAASFPTIPVQQIEQMVAGVAKLPPAQPPGSIPPTNGAVQPTDGTMPPNTGTVQ